MSGVPRRSLLYIVQLLGGDLRHSRACERSLTGTGCEGIRATPGKPRQEDECEQRLRSPDAIARAAARNGCAVAHAGGCLSRQQSRRRTTASVVCGHGAARVDRRQHASNVRRSGLI